MRAILKPQDLFIPLIRIELWLNRYIVINRFFGGSAASNTPAISITTFSNSAVSICVRCLSIFTINMAINICRRNATIRRNLSAHEDRKEQREDNDELHFYVVIYKLLTNLLNWMLLVNYKHLSTY